MVPAVSYNPKKARIKYFNYLRRTNWRKVALGNEGVRIRNLSMKYRSSCKNLCKNPNYDYDLKLDECCLCIQTNARCSSCSDRKFIEKNKKRVVKNSDTIEKNEERHVCLSCNNLFFIEELYDLPAGYYCNGCYHESH